MGPEAEDMSHSAEGNLRAQARPRYRVFLGSEAVGQAGGWQLGISQERRAKWGTRQGCGSPGGKVPSFW